LATLSNLDVRGWKRVAQTALFVGGQFAEQIAEIPQLATVRLLVGWAKDMLVDAQLR
jgi:hypothetical protein